jgi:hypothetical protein
MLWTLAFLSLKHIDSKLAAVNQKEKKHEYNTSQEWPVHDFPTARGEFNPSRQKHSRRNHKTTFQVNRILSMVPSNPVKTRGCHH